MNISYTKKVNIRVTNLNRNSDFSFETAMGQANEHQIFFRLFYPLNCTSQTICISLCAISLAVTHDTKSTEIQRQFQSTN